MLGKQVVVDNRGGGNTVIGNDLVAKSPPDGYTLLLAGSSQVAIPHLYRNIPYDTLKDFDSVAGIAKSEFLLVVHPNLPVRTVADLIALAKKRPGELNYATSSTGGATHLAAVQFILATGVKMQQVPYKGGGPAMIELMGGQVQLAFANPASSAPLVKGGKLRAIAVTGDTRLTTLPKVPTFEEGGLHGLALGNWYAVTAPAGTPKAIVAKLDSNLHEIVSMPDIQHKIIGQGLMLFYANAEKMDAIRKQDYDAVGKVINAAGINIK
jgi:tripartite-type tricarboxylate transporter receptor subunit TctC